MKIHKMDACLSAIVANDVVLFKKEITQIKDMHVLEQYLYFACMYKNESIMLYLLHHQVSPNRVHYNTYPLRSVARTGDIRMAEVLWKNRALLDLPHTLHYCTAPIIEACDHDRTEMVQWLVEKKANLHTRNLETKETPLLIACRRGNLILAEYLLEQDNSGLRDENVNRKTALHFAIQPLNLPLLEILLKHGLAHHVKLCAYVMRDITLLYSYDVVFTILQRFIHYGYSVNDTMRQFHALIYFIQSKKVDYVRYLLDTDTCDVNLLSNEEDTPLHVACGTSYEMVELLLRYHPQLDVRDYKGDTPLCIACMKGDEPMARILLQQGAQGHVDGSDHSTLLKAVAYSNTNVVSLLFQFGANPRQTFQGSTLRQLVEADYSVWKQPMMDVLVDAENAALSTPSNVADTFFARKTLLFRTWYTILSPHTRNTFHHLLKDDKIDQHACYTALHEGENKALQGHRSGENVSFSPAAIRCLGRAYATRPLRRWITSYLVFPSREREACKQSRRELEIDGNAVPF